MKNIIKYVSKSKEPRPAKSRQVEGFDLKDQKPSQNLKAVKTLPQLIDNKAISKLMPKTISTEKERLYEENLSLKQMYNQVHEENLKLRTKVQQLKKKSDSIFAESPSNKNVNLIDRLKNSMKDLKSEVQARNKEINDLKKNLRYTKINELESELQYKVNECERLKSAMNEVSVKKLDEFKDNQVKGEKEKMNGKETEQNKKELAELRLKVERLEGREKESMKIAEEWKRKFEDMARQKEEARKGREELEEKIVELRKRADNGARDEKVDKNDRKKGNSENAVKRLMEFFENNLINAEMWIKSISSQEEMTKKTLKLAIEQDSIDVDEEDLEEFFKLYSHEFMKTSDLIQALSVKAKNDVGVDALFELFKANAGSYNVALIEKKVKNLLKGDKIDRGGIENLISYKVFKLEREQDKEVLVNYLLGSQESCEKSQIVKRVLEKFQDYQQFSLGDYELYLSTLSDYLSSNYETCMSSIQEHSQFKNTITLEFLFQELAMSGLVTTTKEKSILRSFVLFHSKSAFLIDYLKLIQLIVHKKFDPILFTSFKNPAKPSKKDRAETIKSPQVQSKPSTLRSESLKSKKS